MSDKLKIEMPAAEAEGFKNSLADAARFCGSDVQAENLLRLKALIARAGEPSPELTIQEKLSGAIAALDAVKDDVLFGDPDLDAGVDAVAVHEVLQGLAFIDLAVRAFSKADLLQTRAIARVQLA